MAKADILKSKYTKGVWFVQGQEWKVRPGFPASTCGNDEVIGGLEGDLRCIWTALVWLEVSLGVSYSFRGNITTFGVPYEKRRKLAM